MQAVRHAYRVNDSVVEAKLDNELVLLNVETGIYFGLDEVGSMIWSLTADGEDEASIVEHILSEYDIERIQVETDVREFIKRLESKGLLLVDTTSNP